MNIKIIILSTAAICLSSLQAEEPFTSPTMKQIATTSIPEMEKSLAIRKVTVQDETLFNKIIRAEKAGLLGYHGDSLEFMIYQDIIRWVIDLIVGLPFRNDFHFLGVPLDPILDIQTKEELAAVFNQHPHPERALFETTFPLNFALWDNVDRLGLNTIESFTKNESVKPLGYKKRLVWLFERLGIKTDEIDNLFDLAYSNLVSNNGVILQIFDIPDYALSKNIAYPSYPNGFISENVTVDEYFLNEQFMPPYPHEVRLILTNKQTLNPYSDLKMMRYTNLTGKKIATYENAMRKKIKALPSSSNASAKYRQELLKAWEQ